MVNLDIDALVKKAGGRYRLVSLVQKRMRELQRGLPALTEKRGTLLETAIAELTEGKVWLAMGEEAAGLRAERAAELQAHAPAPTPQTPPALGAPAAPPRKPPL